MVNATAYRAYVLADAGKRFGRQDYLDASRRNLNFVLESQAADGSWLYAMNEKKSYIDNFHTCFNLKNLFKIHRIEPDARIEDSIRRGFAYYREHLIDAEGNPKPFAVKPRLQLAKLEMYDFAEGITLGALIGGMIPEAGELARSLRGQVDPRAPVAGRPLRDAGLPRRLPPSVSLPPLVAGAVVLRADESVEGGSQR